MSSVYGPDLLKNPELEDGQDAAIGKKKKGGEEFETTHDRAKRIRKERQAQKEKAVEEEKMMKMNKEIGALFAKPASGGKKVAGAAAPAAPAFVSFGPSAGPSVGPAGPPVGWDARPGAAVARPAAAPAGPARPPVGPAAPAGPPGASDDEAASASVGPAPGPARCPRGPMRPAQEDKPRDGEEAAPTKVEEQPKKMPRLGHMDIMAEQKRVSWDELKHNLANANLREEGVPGSKEFDNHQAKLQADRNERLKQQEDDTKRLLKHINKGKGDKKKDKKKEKDKKEKKSSGLKRTADGAVLAGSDSESEQEDCLLARYKKKEPKES